MTNSSEPTIEERFDDSEAAVRRGLARMAAQAQARSDGLATLVSDNCREAGCALIDQRETELRQTIAAEIRSARISRTVTNRWHALEVAARVAEGVSPTA